MFRRIIVQNSELSHMVSRYSKRRGTMKFKPCKYCGHFVASDCSKCPKCGRVNPYEHTLPLLFIFIAFFIFFLTIFFGYDVVK